MGALLPTRANPGLGLFSWEATIIITFDTVSFYHLLSISMHAWVILHTVFPHLSVLQDFALVGSIAYQPQTGPIKDWGLCKGSLLDRCWQHFGAAAFKFLECQRWNLKITVLCLCDCNGNTIWKHSLPLSSHVLVAYQSRLTIWYNLMQFDTIWLFPNFHRFAKQLQCHGSPLTRSP